MSEQDKILEALQTSPDPRLVELAKKHGMEFGTGRGGGLFFKGPEGKLALKAGPEYLDLVSIGAKEKGGGQRLLGLLDEAANAMGLQARRGTTNLSAAGQESIQKAVDQGFAVKAPQGPGFLSTAQKAGSDELVESLFQKLVSKGAEAAPAAASGLGKVLKALGDPGPGAAALLDPIWGLIQNDPEGQALLQSVGVRPTNYEF